LSGFGERYVENDQAQDFLGGVLGDAVGDIS
jgi:hypothetical protein